MTLARKAFTWFGMGALARKVPEPAAQPPQDTMVGLDRVLQIEVVRAGEVKIFTQEVGLRGLLFRGRTPFEVGEAVTMKFLLRADTVLQLVGTVQWLHQGSGGLSGQIDFQPTPEQEAQLSAFLELRKRKR